MPQKFSEFFREWKQRGIEEEKDFAILTNEISKATFGVDIKKHKELKGLNPELKNQNLRDHMTDLELIFNMLGEKSTTEITKSKNSKGINECTTASQEGGEIAKNARIELEKKTGKKVINKQNYLHLTRKQKIIDNK